MKNAKDLQMKNVLKHVKKTNKSEKVTIGSNMWFPFDYYLSWPFFNVNELECFSLVYCV